VAGGGWLETTQAGEDLSLQLLDAGLDVIGIEENLVGGECPY